MKIIRQGKMKCFKFCSKPLFNFTNVSQSVENLLMSFLIWLILRKLAIKILEVQDPDFYEWETHIFFDDCMEPADTMEPDESKYKFQV